MTAAAGPKPRYDWWVHTTGATPSFPGPNNSSVANQAQSVASSGKKVILHAVMPQTGGAAGLSILNAGAALQFSWPRPGNFNGANTPIDAYMESGLGVASAAAEPWIIWYSVLG